MKLQINSLKAVEKLLKDDEELFLETRSSVLNGFAKNHIKAILNDEVIEKLKQSLRNEMEKNDYFGILKKDRFSSSYGYRKWFLSEEIKKLLRDDVEDLIKTHINQFFLEEVC